MIRVSQFRIFGFVIRTRVEHFYKPYNSWFVFVIGGLFSSRQRTLKVGLCLDS
jgi:hypothetical protein